MGASATGAVLIVTRRWLVLHFDAPLMAFGGVAIDHVGPTRDFPSTSMVTGLIGNALGWHWSDRRKHQDIQDRLIVAARRDREGSVLTDTQNAQLSKSDKAWTTHGELEGRHGASYKAPHRRQRDFHADASMRVVLCLDPAEDAPTLEEVANAFDRPTRPLFLGRKPCLPAAPMLSGGAERWVIANTAHAALRLVPGEDKALRAQWPVEQGPAASNDVDRVTDFADLRNWQTGLHGGSRRVVEGWIIPAAER